jgi:hypothetical protein
MTKAVREKLIKNTKEIQELLKDEFEEPLKSEFSSNIANILKLLREETK